jgi:3-oxoacyl-[acyl-carrier protein] reductase
MITLDLSGKHALVCGSTQGIGKAIALAFAQAGARVTLVARHQALLNNVVEELLRINPVGHSSVCMDFSDMKSALLQLEEYMHTPDSMPIHILVNNTGGPMPGPIVNADHQAFTDTFTQHILMSHSLLQAVLPGMQAQSFGRVINIISTSVKQPIPNLGVSNTIRGAMANWAKTVSFEVAKDGITVNNILPGYIETGRLHTLVEHIAETSHTSLEETRNKLLSTVPSGRFGSPEEVASLATFLASPLAGYINGVSIPLDGGRTTAL